MGSTARFLFDQNVRRFVAGLRTESDPGKRQILKVLLLEQMRLFESEVECRNILRLHLEECVAQISRRRDDGPAAGLESGKLDQLIANLEETKDLLQLVAKELLSRSADPPEL